MAGEGRRNEMIDLALFDAEYENGPQNDLPGDLLNQEGDELLGLKRGSLVSVGARHALSSRPYVCRHKAQ